MISSAAITCPKCKVVIRSASPIPAGKQVKCPKCSTVFKSTGSHPGTMPKSGSQPAVRKPGSSAQGISAKPGSQPGVRKPGSSAQGISAKPGSQQGTVRKPGTSSQGGFRRPGAGSQPGKGVRKKASRGKLFLAVVLFLLLGGVGLAGYFFLGGGSSGSTSSEVASNTASTDTKTDKPQLSDDPLAYVPADANLIIGVDPKALLGMPFIKQGLKAAGPEVEKVLADAKDTVEQAVFAFKVPPGATANPANVRPASMTFIIKWRQASDPRNQTVSTILPGLLTGKGQTLSPTDKILLVSDLPPGELQKLGAKPVVPADTAALVRLLQKNPAWVLLPLTPETRKEIEGSAAMVGQMLPPEIVPVLKALPTAKGISIALSTDDKRAKLTIALACGNDKTAQDVTGSLKVLWAKNKPLLADALKPFLAQLPPDLGTLVEDILSTTTVSAQDQTAQVSARLSLLPLENMARNFDALVEAGMKLAQGPDKTPPPPPKEKARDLTPQEKRFLELTTNFRKASELPPFKENPTLHLVAQKFVAKMAKDNNGNFVDLEELEKDLLEAGYKVAKVDDKAQLAGNSGFSEGDPNPDQLYNVWINTKDPLAKLREKLEETGVAFFINKDKNQVFYLQIYATPHKEEKKD